MSFASRIDLRSSGVRVLYKDTKILDPNPSYPSKSYGARSGVAKGENVYRGALSHIWGHEDQGLLLIPRILVLPFEIIHFLNRFSKQSEK